MQECIYCDIYIILLCSGQTIIKQHYVIIIFFYDIYDLY